MMTNMALNDAALSTGANAIYNEITHLQIHNGTPGAGYTSAVVGTRVAKTGSVDADGDITMSGSWTGLTANQAVTHVSYWTAATGGANRGGAAVGAGDAAANAAGEYSVTAVENGQTIS